LRLPGVNCHRRGQRFPGEATMRRERFATLDKRGARLIRIDQHIVYLATKPHGQ
jgi:hypothetical protein